MGQVKDISHFILQCPAYRQLRTLYIAHKAVSDILSGDTHLRNL